MNPLMMESVLQQILPRDAAVADSPLEQAQQIIYQAYDSHPEDQVALALEAITVCPDCADAYGILGAYAETIEDAIDLYQEGVAAAERVLGTEGFQEYEGHFWGFLETRPYMRARLDLAQTLWSAQRPEEAIEHYRDMLRLNPNDNQGVRYELAACLLELGLDEELGPLLASYEQDDSAAWVYSAALLAFRSEGDSAGAQKVLAAAQSVNKFVPAYLLNAKPLPRELPEYIGRGDDDEAISYAATYLPGWKATPGAIQWLRGHLKVALPKPASRRRPAWSRIKAKYAALPQTDETWQVDIRKLKLGAGQGVSDTSQWIELIVADAGSEPLHFSVADNRPKDTDIWDALLHVMSNPGDDEPRRPRRIEVQRKALLNQWKSKLTAIGVECGYSATIEHVENALELSTQAIKMSHNVEANRVAADSITNDELAALPQHVGEIWQADFRSMGSWVEVDGQPVRAWMTLVTNRDEDLILAQDITSEEPGAESFRRQVMLAMAQPNDGQPHRPSVIYVNSPEKHDALVPQLEPLGIQCVVCDELDQINFMFDDLSKHLAGPDTMAALVDVPGVTGEQLSSFYEAAAAFYQAAPWRSVQGDTAIKVVCEKFETDTWYAVVMGQSGVTLGLAMHEDLEIFKSLLTDQLSDRESARRTSAVSITFGEAFEIAPRDLEAVEKHGWRIAGPEAYPHALRINPGGNLRPPLSWELELLDACLQAVPKFLHDAQGTVDTHVGRATLSRIE